MYSLNSLYALTSVDLPYGRTISHINPDGIVSTHGVQPNTEIIIIDAINNVEIAKTSISIPYCIDTIVTQNSKKLIMLGGYEIQIADLQDVSKKPRIIPIVIQYPIVTRTSSDGKLFCAMTSDTEVTICETESGMEISRVDCGQNLTAYTHGKRKTASGLVQPQQYKHHKFSWDNTLLLIVCDQSNILVFSVVTGKKITVCDVAFKIRYIDEIRCSARFLLISEQGGLYTWDIIRGIEYTGRRYTMSGNLRNIVAVSLDHSMIVYTSLDNKITLVDSEGDTTLFDGYTAKKWMTCFSRDGDRLFVVDMYTIYTFSTNILPRCTKEIFHTFDTEAKKTIRFLFLIHDTKPEKKSQKTLSRLERLPRELIYVIFSHIRRSY